MITRKVLLCAAALVSLAFATGASATVITAQDIMDGNTGGLSFTPQGGALGLKTDAGSTGVGVTGGPSGNEIDLGESITASATNAFRLVSVTLAFLFDGPEFGDYQEIAQLTATLLDGSTMIARLTNIYVGPEDIDLNLFINGSQNDSLILAATRTDDGFPADVTLGALFGGSWLTSLEFTPLAGNCGVGSCTNQSDFSIKSLNAVPAPAPFLLMGIGLVAMGAGRPRRRPR